jgi:hypothetical protein
MRQRPAKVNKIKNKKNEMKIMQILQLSLTTYIIEIALEVELVQALKLRSRVESPEAAEILWKVSSRPFSRNMLARADLQYEILVQEDQP